MRRIDVFAIIGVSMTGNAGHPRTERRLGIGVGRHDKEQTCCIDGQQQGRKYSSGGGWHYLHYNKSG